MRHFTRTGLILTVALVAAVPAINTNAAVVTDGLVHQWDIEAGSGSTITDSVGSNDGTIDGATWSSDTAGAGSSQSLLFDGVDDVVDLGDLSGVVNTNVPFTVEIWAKMLDNDAVRDVLFSAGGGSNPAGTGFSLVDFPSAGGGYLQARKGTGIQYSRSYDGVFPSNMWAQIVTVWHTNSPTTYIHTSIWFNGVKQEPDYVQLDYYPFDETGGTARLGAVCDAAKNYPWYGNIDQVRIYNRALSETEIKQNRTEMYTLANGLAHEWLIEQGTGGIIEDSVGNNDGTIDGATWSSDTIAGSLSSQSLYFDGVDDVVDLGDLSGVVNTNVPFTVEIWAKMLDNDAVRDVLFSAGGGSNPAGTGFSLVDFYSAGGGYLQARKGTGIQYSRSYDGVFTSNMWAQIVTVWHTNSPTTKIHTSIWFNGVKQEPDFVQLGYYPFDETGGNARLGAVCDAAKNYPWYGNIDQVRIYNRALSQAEIDELYNSMFPRGTMITIR